MQTVIQDIRYALRQLCKSPGFTIVAVLTLALGIGANTAIYSIIHGALRLPYPDSERMVAVQNIFPQGKYFANSFGDFEQWRAQARTVSQMVAFTSRRKTLTGFATATPESLDVNLVSQGYLRMYGLRPIVGRDFLPAEHQKGGAPVCVISEQLWHEKFGSNPSIVGKTIDLDAQPFIVIGVAPVLVNNVRPAQVWIPLEPRAPWVGHDTNYLFTTALLRSGITRTQALAELRGIQDQINKQFPGNKHEIDIQPLAKATFGDLHSLMLILQAAVGFILLIACANLANMLLARAANRAREFAVRRALGASPHRLVQQALTESLLLSITGAALGILIAQALTHLPIAAWPKDYLQPSDVHLDGRILLFTALLGILTGIVFGIVPALRILRQDEQDALQQGRTVTESREQRRTRSVLVIAEIALSMLLVAGAMNMAFYFVRVLRTNPGIDAQNALSMNIWLSPNRYAKPEDQRRFAQILLDKLSALPGVSKAALTDSRPFTDEGSNGSFSYDNEPESSEDRNPFADFHHVSPGYFVAAGTPLLQGREFTGSDGPVTQKVAIINRTMAQTLWPGQSAIGKRIHCCTDDGNYTVIGVASDVRFAGPAAPANFTIYIDNAQDPSPALTFILRTRGDPLALSNPARSAVASIDPGQAVFNITSLQALEEQSIAGQRTSTMVTAILGCLALLLASIGVYGVMAYSVSRRQREFAVRMALGANRGGILQILFAGLLRIALSGVVIGAALAIAMRVWIESLIGAKESTPYVLVASALLLCAVAVLATLIPARHAMYVEPMQALRTE